MSAEETCRLLGTDPHRGLESGEAACRLAADGPNALPQSGPRSLWRLVLGQFANPLIYLLLAAAGIALVLGHRGDAGVILVVVVLNAVIGTLQEGRAARSMESLKKLSGLQVRVRRSGCETTLEARSLVTGDVILLAAGDAVAADARLLEAAALETAEAALTGESLPVSKLADPLPEDTVPADRRNMVYSGTHVAAGRGLAVVVATGSDTEVGRIARLTASAEEPPTPLQRRIHQFGRILLAAALVLFGLVIAVGLMRGLPFGEILMVAISQTVSMVPEGLPVAMTIALAVGMQRMAGHGAIVRRLGAVETLGSTGIICTDKTGTLTRNEMTVTALWLPGRRLLEITGTGYDPDGQLLENGQEAMLNDAGLRALLEAVVLCNDARLIPPDDGTSGWKSLGDPTETALLTLAVKGGLDPDSLRRTWPRLAEIPFESSVKMMATWHGHGKGQRILIKGAPESVLRLCGNCLQNGNPVPLDAAILSTVESATEAMGRQALRLLAVAEMERVTSGNREAPDEAIEFTALAGKAVFLGLVGEMDPPRPEVKASVADCRSAGIRPIMVTGDHKLTGLAIARSLGIAGEGDQAVDGRELDAMSGPELQAVIDRISVFARVHPVQKLRIVEALQSCNHVVAMTGDGVNDAPALARADVGVAMGITGTEVAKGAAKIVITDDNFTTIVTAVHEGRLVYQNLRKVVLFLFTTSIDEVLILLAALLMGLPLPLVAVQILWINLVTEGVLTVNLVMDQSEGNEMQRPPTPRDQPLVTAFMFRRMLVMAGASTLSVFGYFVWRLTTGAAIEQVRSETFTVLAVCQWFNVLNCRSERQSVLTGGFLKNAWLVGGLAAGNLLHFLVIYWSPLNRLFHTVPIDLNHFFLIGAVASLVLWAEEIRKWLARRQQTGAGPEAGFRTPNQPAPGPAPSA